MKKRRLNVEMVLDQFDFQDDGLFFAIKFIDPETNLYRIVRFVKNPDSLSIMPENFKNPAIEMAINQLEYQKFLWRLVLLRAFPLSELY
jgi:hypothetical protein